MSLIRNEGIKLTAAWINTIAAAVIVTGVIAPLVAVVFGFQAPGTIPAATFVIAAAAWLLLGTLPHFCARLMLRRLRE